MDVRRREFIKGASAAAALAAAGLPVSGMLASQAEAADQGLHWDKAPCRFCGTGCGVMVGVRDGKVVAVAGDRQNLFQRRRRRVGLGGRSARAWTGPN